MQMPQKFHPELIPRRGEWTAWILAVIALAAWIVSRVFGPGMPGWTFIFVLFFLFSASSISLGNWIDRNTLMRLTPEGVSYRNGLRDVTLAWDEISEVHVMDERWGRRVQVRGAGASFKFRTLGEVYYQGELKGRMGFAQGEAILQEIIESSGLHEVESAEKIRYYSRP